MQFWTTYGCGFCIDVVKSMYSACIDRHVPSLHVQFPSASSDMSAPRKVALLSGAKEPALWHKTIRQLVEEQAEQHGNRTAVIVPWQSFRSTYSELADRSREVSRALLDRGVRHSDCVGVMAGNRHEYVDIFLGAASIGCPVVLLNNTYNPDELLNASKQSCKSFLEMADTVPSIA